MNTNDIEKLLTSNIYEDILRIGSRLNNQDLSNILMEENLSNEDISLYCCYTDNNDIVADTTAIVLLGCNNVVDIPENAFVKIYADKNCDIEIHCPDSSKAIVEHSHGALVSVSSGIKNVEIIDRGYGHKQDT